METGCRHFSGYKPCSKNEICSQSCPSRDIPSHRLLIVHLEALGSVLRTTSILPALKRKYPSSHITWITQRPAQELLFKNPFLDRVLTTERDDLLAIRALDFDAAFVVDKSHKAAGILKDLHVKEVFGFEVNSSTGAIIPATPAAEELWQIGLSDTKKFFENKKTETQLIAESLELEFQRDRYVLELTEGEKGLAITRKKQWGQGRKIIIGINTGCSPAISAKKLTIPKQREIIQELQKNFSEIISVVLLGGRDETLRNQKIAEGLSIVMSPTEGGLRDGIISVAACDIVLTGDSLGLHLAIALKKYAISWFGPTCSHEIDFYGHGEAIETPAKCSPCWKRVCEKDTMCYDLVRIEDFVKAVKKGIAWYKEHSSFKQPSSETSSSLFL